MPITEFQLITEGDIKKIQVGITKVVIAGWTGRNKEAMEEHMAELEAIGIARPKTAPIFYRVSADLLTQNETISVVGEDSSGEVEFFVLNTDEGLCIGVGSDHTDRKVEADNVTISKQVCAKPISNSLWRYDDVIDHWKDLILRSHAIEDREKNLYQEGPITTMLPAEDLIQRYSPDLGALEANTLMFCGTLAVIGGIRPMEAFVVELEDPVLGRKISHQYTIQTLPNEG
jgi:hypothetical protein